MKMFLIADQTETYVGMRLAGIDGAIVHTDEEFYSEFDRAFADKSIGIILVMDEIYEKYSAYLMEKKLNSSIPLIVSVPKKGEGAAITGAVSNYIASAIGADLQ